MVGDDSLLNEAQKSSGLINMQRRSYGGIIDSNSVKLLEEKRDIFYFLSFIVHNTKPVGHQVYIHCFESELINICL